VRTLSLRELNRATLARQLLLERRRLPVTKVLERVAGLQGQRAFGPYVGLWSRVAGFRRESLERALVRGDVLKATVMRGTLHLISTGDYPVFRAALPRPLSWADAEITTVGERLAAEVRELFRNGPLPARVALDHIVGVHGFTDEVTRNRVWHTARVAGHILHAPESAFYSAPARNAFHAVAEPELVELALARVELVRRYLGAFGPASRADLADWSGLRVADLAPALEALEPLRRFEDESGRELLDLPRAQLPPADAPAPVRFLPMWDTILLGHADRTRLLPEEYRKAVIAKNGDVAQTFLVDGTVAGTWRVEKERVVTTAFAPLPRTAQHEVEDEAARLAAWLS
jgi:uncharacterized protein YcaQ